MEVTLTINSGGVEQLADLTGETLTIGRGDASDIALPKDKGLSRRHATIQRRGGQVWVVDKDSTNHSFVNGERVPEGGTELLDGDEIRIGNSTIISVRIRRPSTDARDSLAAPPPPLPLGVRLAVVSVTLILLGGVGAGFYSMTQGQSRHETAEAEPLVPYPTPAPTAPPPPVDTPTPLPTPTPMPATPTPTELQATPALPPSTQPPVQNEGAARRKLYKQMSDEEKAEFIRQRAQHVSIMMGGRPYAITPEALKLIKYWLDAYALRAGNGRRGLWGGDTVAILERGKTHTPVIIRAFREHNVPVVVGVYIPFIETEYTNISTNNVAGAAGLFQFLGATAEGYGVRSSERTNVPKMSVAAARYFRDNIVTFGDGPMGVALSIAGYNRNPESVKRDLRNVLNSVNNDDKERSFWTLVANQAQLDGPFRRENVNYVPRFFAAAIFGETPWAFGIDMRPLTTYTGEDGGNADAAKPAKQ